MRAPAAYPPTKKRAKVPAAGPAPSGLSSESRASGSGDAPAPNMPLPPLPRGSMADAVLQHGVEEGDVIHEGYHREVFIPWVWIHSPEPRGVLHFGSVGDPATPLCSQHKTGAAKKPAKEWTELRGRYKGPETGRKLCKGCFQKLSPTQRTECCTLFPDSQLPSFG